MSIFIQEVYHENWTRLLGHAISTIKLYVVLSERGSQIERKREKEEKNRERD